MMKLYKILYGIGIFTALFGCMTLCGAIEWRTSLVPPLVITAVGVAFFLAGTGRAAGISRRRT